MTADGRKFTLEQVEALELAPAADHTNLAGWVPALASDEDVRQALEKAFDFRGDVTLTLKSGERVEAFIFDRQTGATLADSFVRYFAPDSAERRRLSYADIARLEFTGEDCAAGNRWEDWVRKFNERKAAARKDPAANPPARD